MCGSFLISVEDSDEVSRILRVLSQRYAKAPRDEQDTEAAARFTSLLETRAPTALFPRARIPAIWIEDGEAQPTLMHWGLPGFSGGREIINARCETASAKPLFSSDLARRRCVIPATGFFEWSPDRQRFRFDAADHPELWLAGIYDATLPVPRCCILTRAASGSVLPVHDRMPVIVDRANIAAWLHDDAETARILSAMAPLLDATLDAPVRHERTPGIPSGKSRGPRAPSSGQQSLF